MPYACSKQVRNGNANKSECMNPGYKVRWDVSYPDLR